MQITVYGSGYLSTVFSACLADFGLPVTCCDQDSAPLALLAEGNIPYYERNLNDVIRRNVRAGRLVYSTDLGSCVPKARVVFLAQDSPSYLEQSALKLASLAAEDVVMVIVTPVSVGTTAKLERRLREAGRKATVVCQPVFFTDGCAVEDFNWPDRIIVGTNSNAAVLMLKQVYRPLVMRGVPVIVTNYETAELAREATTAFVATKISFINELARLCERVNADAVDLALALGLDKKIAPRCLQPGAGFGGAFVEADMEAMSQLAAGNGVSLKVLTAAREVNRSLSENMADKVCRALETVNGKELGILGLAFKPNTNSVAGSSSVMLARKLSARGAHVRAYDPVALTEAKEELASLIRYCENAYDAAEGVDALVVGTGWPEFRALDFDKIKKLLKRPIIVDTKNLLDAYRLRNMGFQYIGMGRA
jgi:UDPglucose 6-dehydrogenase